MTNLSFLLVGFLVWGGVGMATPPHTDPLTAPISKPSKTRVEAAGTEDISEPNEGRELASEVSLEEATEALKSLEDVNQILGQVNQENRSDTGEQ